MGRVKSLTYRTRIEQAICIFMLTNVHRVYCVLHRKNLLEAFNFPSNDDHPRAYR